MEKLELSVYVANLRKYDSWHISCGAAVYIH